MTTQLGHREDFPSSGLNRSLDGTFGVPTGNAKQTEALLNQERSVLERCKVSTTSARACKKFCVVSSRWLFLLEAAAGHRAVFLGEEWCSSGPAGWCRTSNSWDEGEVSPWRRSHKRVPSQQCQSEVM